MAFFSALFGNPSSFIDGQFTVATLPAAASNTRKYAWVTDLHDGQPDYVVSDGTNWKPVRPLAVRNIAAATGAMTLRALANSPTQNFKTSTGNADVTLSIQYAYGGARMRIIRPASLFAINLLGLVSVSLPLAASWADMEFSAGDNGWFKSAGGNL